MPDKQAKRSASVLAKTVDIELDIGRLTKFFKINDLAGGVRKPAISGGAEASYFRTLPKNGNLFHNEASKMWKQKSKKMKKISAPPEIGTPAKHKAGQWVQTERKAHEAWARLIGKKPRAAELLHHLVAQMGHQNAVVVSQKVLAELLGVTDRTIRTAIADLVAERWIQVVRLGKGKEAAYVVNDRVAWGQSRDQLRLSTFSATVVADLDDQEEALLGHADLRRIPTLYPGEYQLPTGPGEEPPTQPTFPSMEPDLPTLTSDLHLQAERRKRQDAANFARASMGLSGFKPSPEVEAVIERHINGEITMDEVFKSMAAGKDRPTTD